MSVGDHSPGIQLDDFGQMLMLIVLDYGGDFVHFGTEHLLIDGLALHSRYVSFNIKVAYQRYILHADHKYI